MTNPESPGVTGPNAVLVLGLGQIGGSVLQAASAIVPAVGWSPSQETRGLATDAGYTVHNELVDALEWAASVDALVVLGAPHTEYDGLLRKITRHAPRVLLTDVGSVKQAVAQQVQTITPEARYIGGHPMAGGTESGWAAARPDLFQDRIWVSCLERNSQLPAWETIAGLWLRMGARVVPTTAREHDRAVARVSHLPHLMALALAQVGQLGGPLAWSLAAGSFESGTRVAATRPELIRAMCEVNREALIDAFDDALGIMGVARGSLASTGSLIKATDGGHSARKAYEARDSALTEVTMTNPTSGELTDFGDDGGIITGLARTGKKLTVTGTRR